MENRHSAYDLAQMQSLSLESKIRMTEQRIIQWYEHFDGNVYVSISGGKDSQVLAHIARNIYSDIPLVFVNTGLEYDSVREKGTLLSDTVLRPSMDFQSVIKKYGYPVVSKEVSLAVREVRNCKKRDGNNYINRMKKFNGEKINSDGTISAFNMEKHKYLLEAPFRISEKCCSVMKKSPAKHYEKESGQKPIIGTMAEESRLRKTKWIKHGCNAFQENRPTSQPLSFWTEQDILKYIKKFGLEIADIYGDIVYTDEDGMYYDNEMFNQSMRLTTTGANRTGCIFCMFGISQDKEKFVRLKEQEPKKYDFVMRGGVFDDCGMWIPHNGLGYKFVIDWLNEHGNLGIKY